MKRIFNLKSKLPFLIRLAFSITFMVHAAFIGYGIRYPEHPSTKIYTQNVDQFDLFPISFKFCVKELTNPHYRYQKLGYNSIWSFYKGVIDTSGTLPFVGWAGYNENKSTTQTVQGIADNNNLFFCDWLYKDLLSAVAFNWSGIVDHIEITTTDSKKIIVNGKDIAWSFLPQYPACQTVDLNDYFEFNKSIPSYINIYFNKVPNLAIQLHIEDMKKSLSRRTLLSNLFDYDGVPLVIQKLTIGKFYSFALALSKTINLETDGGKHCTNYPTEKFASYRACDMDFVHNEMKNTYKIMPFWAAKTLDEVTNIL